MTPEGKFKSELKDDIRERFPEAIIVSLDPNEIQGIPDLLILYREHWAALECKRASNASKQPNQEYYVSKLNDMSFSSFIFPENKEEVINAMEQTFRLRE